MAIALRDRYSALAQAHFNLPFKSPALVFKKKGSVGGSAYLAQNLIQLNSQLTLHFKAPFLEEVIPHELAHLIAFQIYGKVKPHGKEWQAIMQHVFYKAPKRTHSFLLPQALKKTVAYHCQCKTHALSLIRHHKIENKNAIYCCTLCHSPLIKSHSI